eukprot:1683020-Amphidinium_carterae.1
MAAGKIANGAIGKANCYRDMMLPEDLTRPLEESIKRRRTRKHPAVLDNKIAIGVLFVFRIKFSATVE